MAFDAFLKIDGIPGESTDEKHAEWIDILSYSQGLSQSRSGADTGVGGLAGGKVDISEMSFVKMLDKSTPKLVEACATGAHIPSATIELCAAAGDKHTYMVYKLSDVLISSLSNGGASGGDLRPTEQVGIRFGKIEWEYTPFDNKGKPGNKIRAGWDLAANKKV